MAGRGLGTLTLDLVVRTGGFTGPLDKAGRDLDKRMRSMQKSAATFGKVIGASLVAGATAFGYAVKAAIDQADQLNEVSKKIGIPTDVLSGLNYAAKLSGVATEELQAGLIKMIKFQADAAKGGKDSTRVFKALGIEIKDAAGNLRNSSDVFGDFAEVFRNMQDGPEKAAIAVQVFGRAGAELIPLLNEGRTGIASYTDELRELGGIVTPATAAAADEFNDNLDKLQVAFGGLALKVAEDLLPALIQVTQEFTDFAKNGDNAATIASLIGDEFQGAAKAILATADELRVLKKLWKEQGLFGEGILSTLDKAQEAREAAAAASAGRPAGFGRGIRGGGGRGFSYAGKRSGGYGDLFEPTPKSGGSKRIKKDVDEVAEAVKRMNAQMAETIALYNETGQAAKVRYEIEFGELAKASQADKDALLLQAQKIDQLAVEKKAREEAIRLEEQEQKAAKEHQQDIKDLLDDLAFETELTKLSNDEKERALILRRALAGATEDEAKQITAAVDKMLAAQRNAGELSGAMDDFRASFSDAVTDVLTGSKSISDAFKSLADTIVAQIARIIANQVTEGLFGAPGSTSGGSGGGLLSSIFGVFLPHHASGTNFAPGGPSIVGEHGPELVNLPRGSQVVPNHRLRGGGDIHITINGGSDPRETALQAGREVRRVLAFSGRG